ncbi:hypothetical protein C1N73_30660 (plasmid) [Priestia aryabhattai]
MLFHIKKTTQKLLMLLGLIGVMWWALVCKVTYGSYLNIPFFHYAVYLIFLTSTGLSTYGWYKAIRTEKAINKLTKSK